MGLFTFTFYLKVRFFWDVTSYRKIKSNLHSEKKNVVPPHSKLSTPKTLGLLVIYLSKFRRNRMHLCWGWRNSGRPTQLVFTEVSVENIADIFRVTQFKLYFTVAIIFRGLSVLSIDVQTGILVESEAARIRILS